MTDTLNREAQQDPGAPRDSEASASAATSTGREASADPQASPHHEALADVDTLAKLAGLTIPTQYREGVATQFAGLMAQAQWVLSAPLPDELEPATVFTP